MKKTLLCFSIMLVQLSTGLIYCQTDDASQKKIIRELYDEVKKNPILRGFDVEKEWSKAQSMHSDPAVQMEIFTAAKNKYANEKLNQQFGVRPSGKQSFSYSYDESSKTGYVDFTPTPMNANCVNAGFENFNFTNWTGGTYTNSGAVNWNTFTPVWTNGVMTQGNNQMPQALWPGFVNPYPNRHTIMTIPPTLNTPPNCIGWDSIAINATTHLSDIEFVPPTANGVTCRLGNANNNYNETERLVYSMAVTALNSQFTISYAVVVYDGGHPAGEQPFFKITTRDQNGNPIAGCGQYQVDASQVSTDPSFLAAAYWNGTGWTNPVVGGFNSYYYKKWTTVGMDLTAYIGQTISIEFRTGDCIWGGHWGYAYVDASCQPATAVVNMCTGSTTAVLVAPPGYNNYQWYGPNGMTAIPGATNDTLNIANAVVGQVYTVVLTNVAGCTSSMQTTLVNTNIQVQSTASTPSCQGGFSGTATAVPIGSNNGYNYSWTNMSNGSAVGGNTGTITGLAPGTYSVVISSPGCGSSTATVTVGVSPPVYYTDIQNFCMNPAQVIAPSPGSNYVWYNPSGSIIGGATTATLSVNNPVNGSAYTSVFTTPSGCKDSVRITITQTVNQLLDTITFCGSVATLTVNPGATNVIWYDANLWPYAQVGSGNNFNVTNPTTSPWWPSYFGTYTNPVSGCKDSVSVYLTNMPSSVYPSNIVNTCVGQSTGSVTLNMSSGPPPPYSVTVTGPVNYTNNAAGTTVNLANLPAGTYSVSFNNGQCTASCTFTINSMTVNVNATVAPATICAGQTAVATFTYGGGAPTSCGPATTGCGATTTQTVGTGILQNGTTSWPCVYGNWYSNEKYQILYSASDLLASGMTAGKISSIAFNVASIPAGMNTTFINYTIKIGCTTVASLDPTNMQWGTIPFVTPVTQTVWGPANKVVTVGWNIHPLNPVWEWDGVSNIIVEICYDWVGPSNYTSNAVMNQTATTYASFLVYYSDGVTACPQTSGSASYMQRPNTQFSTCQSVSVPSDFTYSWNPITGVSGTPPTVNLTPTVTTNYVCTVTSNVGGCSIQLPLPVTVSTPSATATNAGPYCPTNTIQLNAAGGGTYAWSGPNGFTSTLQNPTIANATSAMSGVYTVTVTLNGCTATATTSVTVNSTLAATASNTGPFCSGGTVQLNANGGTTYSWSGPNGFTSALQNPTLSPATTLMSGVYTVTATTNGCTGTATTTVTVNATTTVTATNTGPYCEGSTISLSGTGGGTYSWSGPNMFSSTLANPAIALSTTSMSGVYTVTATVNGCTSTASTTVTVNALPVPSASNTGAYCAGAQIDLTATGGGTYSWSGPSAFTSSVATPSIPLSTTANSGVYTVTVTLNGCTATATTSVTVNALPVVTATNNGPYCEGATISLNGTGGGTYAWSGPNLFTSAVASPTIASSTTAMSGLYTVTITLNGCTSTATTSVTVNALPVPSATNTGPYCTGTAVQLNGSGGGTYAWSGPSSYTSSLQNPSPGAAGPLTSGVYTLTVTLNGCTATATTTVTVNLSLTPAVSGNSPLCAGDTLNLFCANGVSWTWTGPNAFSSTVQNPSINGVTTAAAGTYSITATDAVGCTGTGTISVVVNALPVVTVNSTAICLGQGTATLTAAGASTYVWSTGTTPSTGATVTAAPGATTQFTVSGTDANGCISSAISTVTVNALPVITVNNTGPYCVNGTIQLNASGGTSYAWTGPNAFSSAIQNPTIATATTAEAGQYDVTVTDANGCVSAGSTIVAINTTLVPNLSSNSPVCVGDTLNLFCGNGNSWSWTGPNSFSSSAQNPSINGVTAAATGTYSISLVDANGCVGNGTIAVVINALPNVTVNSSAICFGQGTATLNAGGASTYSWSAGTNPSTGGTVAAAPSVTTQYTVTGTDVNGCVDTAVSTVTVNPLPVISVSNTGPYCVNGTIQLNATGGTTYAWTGPNAYSNATANPTITPATTAEAGQYDVTVTDANGCVSSGNTIVVVNTSLVPSLSANSPVCEGDTLNLFCTNGVSWTWTGPNAFNSAVQNPSLINVTPAESGTYSISLTDANGCIGSGTISVTVNPLPVVTVTSDIICLDQDTATLVAAGASSYSWSAGTNPLTGASVEANPALTTQYTVTGIDANGCLNTATATVTVNALPAVAVNSTAICPGFSANLTATGASNYAWSAGTNPSTGATVSVSPAATSQYTVTGTDANGCYNTAVSTVTVNSQLTISAGPDDTVCTGDSYTISATGPAGTTYTWNSGSLSGPTHVFVAGTTTTYTLDGVDANGCAGSDTVIITVPAPIVLSTAGFGASCNGVCDGQIVTIANPSAGPFSQYTYLWSDGSVTPGVLNACAGSYTVTVTNNAGCTASDTASVTQPAPLVATANNITPANCNGVCDGAATINASGGNGSTYTYSWSSVGTGSNPTNLCAGNYTCTVTDINNCSVPVTLAITEPPVITVSVSPVSTICIGQTATLTATAGGGNGGYVYSWTGGTTPTNLAIVTANPAVTGSYSVSVTDVNGCTPANASVTVTVNPPLTVTASGDVTICEGQTTTLTSTANGGDGNYTYSWAVVPVPGTASSVNVSPVAGTTYTVTVNDGCGSPFASDSVQVNVNPLPTLNISADINDGCAPLCVNFNASSNPASATVNWSFTNSLVASGTPTSVCFDEAGVYGATIDVTDVNGCQNSYTDNSLVTVYPVPDADFSFGPQPATEANPLITFSDLSIGATINNWNWSFGDEFDSGSIEQNPSFSYTGPGSYDVWLTVVSDHGCIDSINHVIVINPEFAIYVPNAFTPDGNENNDFFFAKGTGIDTDNYEMWIYDRWGNMIWHTDDFFKGWDGRVEGKNEIVQQDVYVWKIILKTFNGEKKSYVGHVTVVK